MKQLLMFLLFSLFLCWMMFSPVYKHVLILRQAVLQKEVDYLLEVGASGRYGYIDEAMIAQSKARLAERGYRPEWLQYTVETTSGVPATNPSHPVPRGTGIRLTITYPYEQLFSIDKLVGMDTPDPGDRMGATGMKMSEYVP